MTLTADKIKACILGHAIGDALGVPVEFESREEIDKNPVTEMRGFGTYPYPAGSWSDDTSMTLCALDSLAKGKLDYDDIMMNFGKWYYKDEFTPTGEMFDVGNTCSFAIDNYFAKHLDIDHCGLKGEMSNGNGSLMRILPFTLFLFEQDLPLEEKIECIHKASALTHAHERSKVACGIYSFIVWSIFRKGGNKASILNGLRNARNYYKTRSEENNTFTDGLYRHIGNLFRHFEDYDTFRLYERDDIKSSGYVVDSLEAAVWCVLNTNSYRECVLKAVNLGDDTDTVAAIAGGLAGALYGLEGIPTEWLDKLQKREYIEGLCEKAADKWSTLRPRKKRTIEFGKDKLATIPFDKVRYFSIAEGGAMGEPGGIIMVTEDKQTYHTNYCYGDVSLESINHAFPVLSHCVFGMFGIDSKVPEGWHYVSLGMGNHLIVHDSVFSEFESHIKGCKSAGEIYQKWLSIATDTSFKGDGQGTENT